MDSKGEPLVGVQGAKPLGLACLLTVLALSALWPRAKVQAFDVFDQPFYLGIAYDLVHAGRFTNGYFFQEPPVDAARPPGMRFTPVYPALLAGASAVDGRFAAAMDCLVASRGGDASCSRSASLVRWAQFGMLACFYVLVWGMARRITGCERGGWVGLGLALLTAPELLNYVNYMMTEITALTLATGALAAGVRGIAERRGRFFVLAGGLAGCAALTRPAYFYLFLVCAAAGFVLALIGPGRSARFRRVAGFAAAGVVVVVPWLLRNFVVLGDASLTAGYGPQVLVQRVAFDLMSWTEFFRSLVCWLPDGNGLGGMLFGPGACHRFQWADQADNFYAIGNGPLMAESLAASGGWPHMFSYLLHKFILAEPVKYAAVTVSLALRGAWVSNYWGLVLAPVCAIMTWRAAARLDWLFLAIALPAWFMLIFAAAVSVNQTRYNLMLIPAFAVAGAMAVEAVLARRRLRESYPGG